MPFETPNLIIGIIVIIINLLPLILKKPKYLLFTGILSVLLILGLKLFG